MGWMRQCWEMGIPPDLTIPVLPWDAGWAVRTGRDPNGKMPARFDAVAGRWAPSPNWSAGSPAIDRTTSDEYGCNVGLLCGQTVHKITLVALDGDLNADSTGYAMRMRAPLLENLASVCNFPGLPIRNTILPRFATLAGIKDGGDVGRKTVITLEHHDGERIIDLGKLELLTSGEQFVIAGVHQSGAKIEWHRHDMPDALFRAPPIHHGLPVFESLDAYLAAVLRALEPFAAAGIVVKVANAASRATVGASRKPEDLTPPSPEIFCNLLRRLPNPRHASSEQYHGVWFCLEGCRRALRALGRLSDVQQREMVEAVVEWCQRWDAPPDKTIYTREQEIDKLNRYYSVLPLISSGWGRLRRIAQDLGLSEIAIEEAQRTFLADLPVENVPWPLPKVLSHKIETTGLDRQPAASRAALDVPLSDIQIADHLEKAMDGNAVFVTGENRWMIMSGDRGWDGSEQASVTVELWIETLIADYAAKFSDLGPATSERWSLADKQYVMSTARIQAVQRRLQTRMSKPSETERAKYILQTPKGAFDLRNGNRLSVDEQRALMDTRCTKHAPKVGPTPMFDELLLNLSDGDKEVQEYIFHYLGYSLLGNPVCRAFLFIWGTAQNGKSTLVRVMRECLGDYCAVIKKDVFLERGKRLHATDLYRIKGVRLAFAVELPKDEKWDEELLKSLTGNDEIQAREIHGKAQSFRAEAVLGFVGNNIPTVDHVDQALADRCRIIGTTFVPDKSDGLWEARLIANECPAIIAKLATYANAVFKNEMRLPQMPEAMMRRTARYLGSQDDFFAWSSDELLTGANHRASEVPLDELKSRFEAWLRRRTETDDDGTQLTGDRVSNKIFQAGLRRLGLTMSDEKGGALMADIGFDGLVRRVKMVRGCAFRVAAVVNS